MLGKWKGTFLILLLCTVSCETVQKPADDGKPIKPQAEYTKDDPGNWQGLESEHLPRIDIDSFTSTENITVYVPMKSAGNGHYIERIGIMDVNGRDLAGRSFPITEKYFQAKFNLSPLPSSKDKVKVYVKCNLHDLWTAPLPIK